MIKEYLNQPYPQLANKWKQIIFISLFIAFFMLVFQPFGLTTYQASNKTFIIAGYGLITFLILSFNLYALPYFFKKWFILSKWTVLKQIIWLTLIIFTIGIGNYYYSSLFFQEFKGLKGLLIFQFFTLSIGIIPIVVITILNQNLRLSHNLKEASDFNIKIERKNNNSHKEQLVFLTADNEKDKLKIVLTELLYIESIGNYIQVYFLKEGKLKNSILRSSLTRIEIQLKTFPSIVKTHRAFLVNSMQIAKVKGNSQGLTLTLKVTEAEIPVSRNYAKLLKEKLNSD